MSDTKTHSRTDRIHRITIRLSDDDLKELDVLGQLHKWFRPPVSEVIRDCIHKTYHSAVYSMSDKPEILGSSDNQG